MKINTKSGQFKPVKTAVKRTRVAATSAHLIGALREKIRVTGDITSTGQKWHAQS